MDEDGPKPENPVVRGVGCVLVLLLFGGALGAKVSEVSLPYAAGASLGQTGIIFAILYFTWLRRAPLWISVVSFVALFLVIGFFTLAKTGEANLAARQDATTLTEIRFDADGNPILPTDAATRGPMSKVFAKIASDGAALDKEYTARLEEAGAFALFDARKLQSNPKILRNCDAFAAIGPDIAGFKTRHFAIMENARRDMAAADMPDDIKANAVAGLERSLAQVKPSIGRIWDVNAKQVDEVHAVCRVLARGTWEAQGSGFGFHSQRDMDDFNRHNDRVNALAAELQMIVRENQKRMQQKLDSVKQLLN